MGETAQRHHRASGTNSSPLIRTLDKLSEHRHLVLAAGVLLMLVAAWCGWHQVGTSSTPAAEDEFAELEGFDAEAAPAPREVAATDADPLIVPAPLMVVEPPPWDSGALSRSLAGSAEEPSMISLAISQELSTQASTDSTPVWFVGTIEPVDASIELPAWTPEPVQRYTRDTNHSEPSMTR
jgi:hypothetical protein